MYNINNLYESGKLPERYYNQLIKVADYLVDNDLYDEIFLSLYSEDFFCPKLEIENEKGLLKDGKAISSSAATSSWRSTPCCSGAM